MSSISSIGILFSVTNGLTSEQSTLATLNEQLASGKLHDNLTDYDTTSANNLLNFQNGITQNQGYITSMQTVQARLSGYDTTMTDMETVATSANTLASQNQNYDTNNLASLQAQAQVYLKQITLDLNQQVGSRYIYAGTRYSTQPVVDLTTLTGAPSSTTVSSPTLPDYDSEYVNNGTTTDANAYTQDSAVIDQGFSLTYGVTSTNPSFQQLISGIQYISQATKETTAAAYQSDMTTAATLLSTALNGIQTIHAQVANNQNTLTTETNNLTTDNNNLENQVGNIQQVDLTSVGTQINFLQTQLSASYSATATLEQLSILKYL